MLTRRALVSAGSAALAIPAVARADGSKVLRFIPSSDVTVLDPVWTTVYSTRNHGLLVFDTLYGIDAGYASRPQMVAGHVVEDNGRLWRLSLRRGLRFHDGTPVLARDCVASIRRWARRDAAGQTLAAYTDEISAADDSTILFRLKRPFPLLPDVLGKVISSICAIMPERLASTDPFTAITQMVGSGPFRYKADERVTGSLAVYEKFDGYVPREEGITQWTSGPKRAFVDRVEWHVMPDQGTAAASMQRGEMDWWESVPSDLMPLLGRIQRRISEPTGFIGFLRLNELQPPFDNPAIRRVLLQAINQQEYMEAVKGDDPASYHVPVGFFCPGLPMATQVGLKTFTGDRDYGAARRALVAAGYKSEPVVVMGITDADSLKALGNMTVDLLQRIGFVVDYQETDYGTVVQRRTKRDPVDHGGWSVFGSFIAGLDQASPLTNYFLKAGGESGMYGWPKSEKLEVLRQQWLDAPDQAARANLAAAIQSQALEDVPYIPLGQVFFTTAYQNNISGVLDGPAIFWNVHKT